MMCKTSADSKAQMKFCGNHKASVSQILINQTLYGGETGLLFRLIALSLWCGTLLKGVPFASIPTKLWKILIIFWRMGVILYKLKWNHYFKAQIFIFWHLNWVTHLWTVCQISLIHFQQTIVARLFKILQWDQLHPKISYF